MLTDILRSSLYTHDKIADRKWLEINIVKTKSSSLSFPPSPVRVFEDCNLVDPNRGIAVILKPCQKNPLTGFPALVVAVLA